MAYDEPRGAERSDVERRVFVYGTLLPGHLRWPVLEPFVVSRTETTCPGRLYDTGWGYPAARFDHEGSIRGIVADLDPDRLAEAWAMLDEIEGEVYERRPVRTGAGWAAGYQYLGEIEGFRDLDGTWHGV